ncbi:WD40-repeat-containing domain protein [Cyathus striatus]|nr:WD40-repeat-containing domain protein [Cyathus striatus]
MPDSFFTSSKPRKRKRTESSGGSVTKRKAFGNASKPNTAPKSGGVASRDKGKKKLSRPEDEELSDQSDDGEGIEDMDLRADEEPEPSGDEDEDETPAEKRLRLAKLYLDSIKHDLAEGEFDAAEIDKELIQSRLRQDVLEHAGKVHLFVAGSYDLIHPRILRVRGHKLPVTCAIASENCSMLFTAGKEGSIVKWDLSTGKKVTVLRKQHRDSKGKGKAPEPDVQGHTDEVLALAISGDGKLLASSGKDRRLCIWDAGKGEWKKSFTGPMSHKDTISALAFRKSTNQLYTGSFDRTLKVYDLTPSVMGYVETLFGHQDHVLGIDALRGETCVSVGARDKTARFWKISDETQLVFRGGGRSRIREVIEGGLRADDDDDDDDEDMISGKKGKEKERNFIEASLECIAMIDESTFVSGGDSGAISLWTTQKKKPVFSQALAHGFNEVLSSTEGLIQTPRWITALASLRYSDLFASGSWDGCIRLWKLDSKLKSFSQVGSILAPGVINSLQLLSAPKTFATTVSWPLPLQQSCDVDVNDAPVTSAAESKRKDVNISPVLLVAGIGQEHKYGRWLKVKESGAANAALAILLSPRTA